MGLVENAAENIQGKKQFAKLRMLQIEEGKHVYYIYTFVTLTFRTGVILAVEYVDGGYNDDILLVTHSTLLA